MRFVLLLLVLFPSSIFAQPTGTLVVVNKSDNSISIINLATGTLVANIATGSGPHEVAVSPSGKWAAVTNYGDMKQAGQSISVIDIEHRKTAATIDLGIYQRPHGIEFISEEEVLITSEIRMALILVNIKTSTVNEIAGTAQQGSHMVAWSPVDKLAYVSNVGSGTVSVIDVPNKKLVTVHNFAPGIEGLAISPDGKYLWVANRNDSTVVVAQASSGNSIAVLPAHQVAFRVKVLPNGSYAVVSNGLSGNLGVYDTKERKFLKDIALFSDKGPQPVPVGIATDLQNNYIYVCLAGYDEVVEINIQNWTINRRMPTGKEPDGVYYSKFQIKA